MFITQFYPRLGADAKTLQTAAPFLMYSTSKYSEPVWCRTAHTRLIESALDRRHAHSH